MDSPQPGDQIVPDSSNQDELPKTTNDTNINTGQKPSAFKPLFLLLLILVVVAGAAYALYVFKKPAKTTSTASVKEDIPVLNVGVNNLTINLYPDSLDSYARAIDAQVFEGLVQYRQTKIVPLLATGWSNPDSSTWDFDLRHNVTFHNGHTMTAKDVVYSLNLAKQNENLADIFSDTIKDIKAVNDYKVEITTTKVDPFFLNKLAFLMILDSKAPDAKDASNGTGPYKLKPNTKVATDKIQLVAYDNYHGGHVYTRALNYLAEVDEATGAKDYQAGKLNISGEYPRKAPAGLGNAHYSVVKVEDIGTNFMTLNTISPGPLQKKQVRQALQLSLDTSQLIKDSKLDATPTSQITTQAITGYDPSLQIPKRDVVKAKALLTQAGYPNGVSLSLQALPDSPTVPFVIKQAAEAGIKINFKPQADFNSLVGDILDGKTEATIIGYSSDVLDGSDVFGQVLPDTNYQNSDFNKYLSAAGNTVDQAVRLKELQKASQVLYDDVGVIPLYRLNRTWIFDKPYVVQFDANNFYPGIYFWEVYTTK